MERAIDLQLIKPVKGKNNLKGKITLKKLFKEELSALNVPFVDPCCENAEPGSNCPILSQDEGNILECRDDGLFAEAPEGLQISSEDGNQIVDNSGLFAAQNIWQVDSIDDLATLDVTLYQTAIVKNVGVYTHTASVSTVTGYTVVAGVTGYWVLDNAAIARPKKALDTVMLTRVIPGGISGGLDPDYTLSGAMTTATITNVNGYDNFVVTGGNQTSRIYFNNVNSQDNFSTHKALVFCDNIGVTSPTIGIGYYGYNLAGDTTGPSWICQMSVNLLTKTSTHYYTTGVAVANTVVSSAGTLAVNGDILELEMYIDQATSVVHLYVTNVRTGEYLHAYTAARVARYISFQTNRLLFNATDGEYALLKYELFSSVRKQPLLGIMGDSYACGDLLYTNTNFPYLLQNALPSHDIACFAGNGAYILSLAQYQLKDILRLRPKYVLIFDILMLYWGYFDDGDANQTTFDTNMDNIMKAITSYGGIPIHVKWQTAGGYINGNSAAWDIKRASIISTYPTTLTLDISGEALGLNNNNHLNTGDTVKVSKAIIALLKNVSAI